MLLNNEDVATEIDRIWYDSFEESSSRLLNDHISFNNNEFSDINNVNSLKKKRRMSYKRIQGNIDNQKWELNRLGSSGIIFDSELSENKEVFNELEVDDNKKIHISINYVYPKFLKSLEFDFKIYQKSNMGNDEVTVIKDRSSDIARLAKSGSSVLKSLKLQENNTKMRERFWELNDSKMGTLIKNKTNNFIDLKEINNNIEKKKNFGEIFKDEQIFEDEREKIIKSRKQLPVYKVKDELMKLINEYLVIIVVGETGSGKTTQLAQYLHEFGYSKRGIIGCTQPRRVAAVSVAKRVAEEMNVELGKEVGYSIRFEDLTSKSTIIKYMTDGVLMRESLNDTELEKYSVIIMDEAHERSLNTDVLFGIFRGILASRRDFRLIITSATMDSEKLSTFFGNAPIFNIPGRTFPVEIEYLRFFPDDYIEAAVRQCLKIHCSIPKNHSDSKNNDGDILIFMTGQEDIEATCYLISEKLDKLSSDGVEPLVILPIYSQLPSDLQAKIFKPSPFRKVIVATNIAETSLTLHGIKYVIDCGLCKVKVYNPKIGMDSLLITPISQANASQRSGRAGRTAPGICYRMYTENTFYADLFENSVPEIQRTNLSNVLLLLKSLGSENIFTFPFIDPPSKSSISSSLYQLWSLGALDDHGNLTHLGSQMSKFPLDPFLSKSLLTANELDCVNEVIIIVAMLSVPSIFFRPKDRIEECESVREKFSIPESDHLTLLNVFLQWKRHHSSNKWSEKHFLHQKALLRVQDVYNQIIEIFSSTMNKNLLKDQWKINYNSWDNVRKAISSGYFHNSAKIHGIGQYVNLTTSVPAYIHPTSSLYYSGVNPDYVVYHEVIITTKEYMNTISAINPEWLHIYAPHVFKINVIGLENSDQDKQINMIEDEHQTTNIDFSKDLNIKNTDSTNFSIINDNSKTIEQLKNKNVLSFDIDY